VIDDGLGIIRKLWTAGLAHRDIKPANLLVRDGRLLLIDVAFTELCPTPWRQAVDLANMMLCLALRASPERVYQRALRQFSEGFAAARGLALPS
jgi:tRNA A-37 threonylcarbamoyl transferase component Bud32